MIGLAVAAVGLISVLWCLFADVVPAIWPATPIKRTEQPGAFWAYVSFYTAVTVGGALFALGH